jgi:hypothetical protein
MYYAIISGVALISSVVCFILGVRMGNDMSKGRLPKTPIQSIKENVSAKVDNKKKKRLDDEIHELMGITKDDMIYAIRSGKDKVAK